MNPNRLIVSLSCLAALGLGALSLPMPGQGAEGAEGAGAPDAGPSSRAQAPAHRANPDGASIDALMKAFYEVVNVRPEAPRQWARDRELYAPWTRFVSTSVRADGTPQIDVWDHAKLVEMTEPLIRRGFAEREIFRRTRVLGPIAHVDSTYETELSGPHGVQRSRGVNSIELYHDGERWWISSVMWVSESPQTPIPPDLLPASTSPAR